MSDDLTLSLRKQIIELAQERCEYCHLPQRFALHKHEPDHIIPRQHGGKTSVDNLALACFRCNRHKGPNIGSFDPEDGTLVPFFHPRRDRWDDHFVFVDGEIQPLTPKGRVTIQILGMNESIRVEERKVLFRLGIQFN